MNTTSSIRSFGYGIGCSLGDTVVAYLFTVARWAVLFYDFFTSEEVIATCRWVGAMTVALAQLVWWSAVWVYAHIQEWAEREVQSCIQQPTMEVMDIPTVSAPQDSPVSPASTPAGTPSRDALRKEAKHRKIPGYSRMTKPQLLEALGYV